MTTEATAETAVAGSARHRESDWSALLALSRSIWIPIVAICLGTIGSYLFNEWSMSNISQRMNSINRLMTMQSMLSELRSRMSDAESGQRGFLLSGKQSYLEPYNTALMQLPVLGARLRLLAAGDAELMQRVQQLESLRGENISELRATVMLASRGERSDALLLVRTGEDQVAMDQFREASLAFSADLMRRIQELRASAGTDTLLSRLAFGALGILTVVLLIVTVRLLLRDYHRQDLARRNEATERQRLEQVVTERTAELSDLTTFLQRVAEQEKADLARELHDEMGGLLTAAKMDLAWLMGRASATEPEARDKLDQLAGTIEEAMSVKRRVTSSLRPALLDHFGLPTALKSYFEDICGKANLGLHIQISDSFGDIPHDVGIALFRIGQESLTNILRHSHAQNVELHIEADESHYCIRICDDGIGISSTSAVSGMRSHGIAGMRHRSASLGGEFRIEPRQPRGTVVRVRIPRAAFRSA